MSKPSSEQVLAILVARSDLTSDQVQTAALDLMHFMVSCLDAGMEIGVKSSGKASRYRPLDIVIPGVTTEHP